MEFIRSLIFIFTYILFSLAIFPLLLNNYNEQDYGSILFTSFCIFYLIYGILFVKYLKFNFKILEYNKPLLFLLIICVFSLIWSVNQSISARKLLGLLGCTIIGFYWVRKYPLIRIINLIFFSYFFLVLLSFIFVLFLPNIGVHQDPIFYGNWRGVFTHKNSLGYNMIFSLLFSVFFILNHKCKTYKIIGMINIILSFILIIFSTSKTSLVISIILFVIILIIKKPLKFKSIYATMSFLFFFISILSITAVIAFNYRLAIFEMLGKDASMTGRVVIWKLVINKILEKPILGYGYQSFWTGFSGPSAYISHVLNWAPPHAHNGILDIFIQFGLVGFLIMSCLMLFNFINSLKIYRTETEAVYLLPFVFFITIILTNITETNILFPNSVYWTLFVYFTLYVTKKNIV